ncbi:unnamed protein product [Cuscuta campestris]|uniref:DUF1664 domain-containing protein n=1 Tax=Cuscuta campestris TaxID=132261 RepID=A0A484LZV8_9ASTE|nr:unnamed protein product [Cuscuta campestris]
MALPIAKVAFLLGTGVVVSALSKESSLSDYFSGAFKIFKKIKGDSSKNSNPKPCSNALLQQVNSLREELKVLASNRSITIVAPYGSGSSSKYGLIVVVVVVGYGYIWWKGWKLSDMMFATRRGLSDACASVSKELEGVYTSVSATRRHLSSRIDRVDCKVDECIDNTAAIKGEVSEFRGEVKMVDNNLQSVHLVVKTLENKISRIEWKQNEINFGLGNLVGFAMNLENERATEQIEASASSSTRPALEMPEGTLTVVESLPRSALADPPSPSGSNGPQKESLHAVLSSSGVKIRRGLSDVVGLASDISNSPTVGHGGLSTPPPLESKAPNSSLGVFGRTLSASAAALFTRSRAL